MILTLLIISLFLVSCAPHPPPDGFVIVGASVLDGQGGPARPVNVRVVGDTVTSVGEESPPGIEIMDAAGLTLAPGFIDTHTHGDSNLSEHRDALAAVSQGITTIVGDARKAGLGAEGGKRPGHFSN